MRDFTEYVRRIVKESMDIDKKTKPSTFDYERTAADILQKYGRTSDRGWEVNAVKQFVNSLKTYGNENLEWDEAKLVDTVREMHDEYMGKISDKNVARIY